MRIRAALLGIFLAVLAVGCMSADERARRAQLLEAEIHLTRLGVGQMDERRDQLAYATRPDSVKIRAINDTILEWRLKAEKMEGELRSLRR